MGLSKSISKRKQTKPLPKRNLCNEYHDSLIDAIDAFDMIDYWKRLSPKLKEKFLGYTIRPIRYVKGEGEKISNSVLLALRKDISTILDRVSVTSDLLKRPLSVNTYFTGAIGLRRAIVETIDLKNPDYHRWMAVVSRFDDIMLDLSVNPMVHISAQLTNLCRICTSLDKAFYYFDSTQHMPTRTEKYYCLIFKLRTSPAEKKMVSIDNKNRPAYRLGISRRKRVKWAIMRIEPEGSDYPVYIQVHAVERLKERLDPLQMPDIQVMLYNAFDASEFSRLPDGAYLAAIRYQDAKVGYLVVDIIDTIAVVKTFLFITQAGTPEGDMFNRLYNVSRFTRQYFGLDKLGTFTHTDVYHDKDLKKLFTRCGCGELFTVWEGNKHNDISFNSNYALNLKKIFVNDLPDTCFVSDTEKWVAEHSEKDVISLEMNSM